jgi:hypothetical protein
MTRILRYVLIGLGIALVAIQFIPVKRSNPPVTGLVDAPEDVMTTLRRSCWNCHSNETEWPWYAYIAPVSWRVSQHVWMAREHVNFTEWDSYDAEELDEAFEEIAEEIEKGGMPLSDYLLVHRKAKLTASDRERLIAWAEAARERIVFPGR